MQARRVGLVLMAFLPLAGCVTQTSSPVPPWTTTGTLAFDPPVAAMPICPVVDCGNANGWEPSVAVTPAGMLVASSFGSMARSTDGGRTFTRIPASTQDVDRFMAEIDGATPWLPFDVVLRKDDQDRIWSVSLVEYNFTTTSPTVANVIHVARTRDLGLTWDLDVDIPVSENSGHAPDRPWLTFGPKGVLVTWQNADLAVRRVEAAFGVLSSDDGRTWHGLTQVAPGGGHGQPIWDGREFLAPYDAYDGHVRLAASSDGQQWEQRDVTNDPYATYPQVASAAGRTWVAWRDYRHGVSVATTEGTDWTRLGNLSDGLDHARPDVWIVPRAADRPEILAAYYTVPEDRNDDAAGSLVVEGLHMEDGKPVRQRGVAATGLSVDSRSREFSTDFAFVAPMGDKVVAVVPRDHTIWVTVGG